MLYLMDVSARNRPCIVVTHYTLTQPWSMVVLVTVFLAVSGGHTSEMLRLVSSLSSEYYPRLYVVASTDTLSEQRARAFEAAQLVQGKVHFARIPRLREVGESMVSSMLSSVRAVLATGPVVVGFMPDLVRRTSTLHALTS